MKEVYNTLEYYNKNAKQYCEQTLEGKIQENYDRFLKSIPKGAYILDFGCESGRGSKYFIEHGYRDIPKKNKKSLTVYIPFEMMT